MTLLGELTLEGTVGDALTAASVGCDDISGSGAADYRGHGLYKGYDTCARFYDQRVCHVDLGAPLDYLRAALVWNCQSGVRPTGADADLFRLSPGLSNDRTAGWGVRTDGKVFLAMGGNPDASVAKTEYAMADTHTRLVKYEYDVRVLGEERQRLWTYNGNGKLLDHCIATVDDVTPVEHLYFGICNTATVFTSDMQWLRWSDVDTDLYFLPSLDTWRIGGFTNNRVSVGVQIQGGPTARMTTSGPVFRTQEVALDEYGLAIFTETGLDADRSPSHTFEVDGNDGWSQLGETIQTYTLPLILPAGA